MKTPPPDNADALLRRALRRLELINGGDSKCCMNPIECPNHSLIREIKEYLNGR